MIGAIQFVSGANGNEGQYMIEHPTLVRVTFQSEPGTAFKTLNDVVHALDQKRFVTGMRFDKATCRHHQGNLAIEEKAASRLRHEATQAGIGHKKKVHA